MTETPVVTIFGSHHPGPDSAEYDLAYQIGRSLALSGMTVCNGGYAGTMEAASRGAKEAGGSTIGVTSEIFSRTANAWTDKEIRTKTLVERILTLVELGQAYVVLRGGTGTLLELAIVWEFINKRMMTEKPIVIVGPFWKPLVDTVREELLWEGLEDGTRFVTQVETADECATLLHKRLRAH